MTAAVRQLRQPTPEDTQRLASAISSTVTSSTIRTATPTRKSRIRHEVDVEAAADRGGVAGDHVEGGNVPGVLQAGDDSLGRAHAGGEFRLRQTGRLARLDHLADNGEDGAKPVILGLDLGVGQQVLAQLGETVMAGSPWLGAPPTRLPAWI